MANEHEMQHEGHVTCGSGYASPEDFNAVQTIRAWGTNEKYRIV